MKKEIKKMEREMKHKTGRFTFKVTSAEFIADPKDSNAGEVKLNLVTATIPQMEKCKTFSIIKDARYYRSLLKAVLPKEQDHNLYTSHNYIVEKQFNATVKEESVDCHLYDIKKCLPVISIMAMGIRKDNSGIDVCRVNF